MTAPVPGPRALVTYIRTGGREARIAYRDLPEKERFAYHALVRRVFETALAHHFGRHPSREQVLELVERVGDRHPQYAGGVRRVVRSTAEGTSSGGMSVRQVLTAQHLVIREIAKLHPAFLDRADEIVEPTAEFTGTDPHHAVKVTINLDGTLRELELLRGVERIGGRTLGMCLVRAWVAAEKQRWRRAKELGQYDDFPEIGSGKGRGDAYRREAYSTGRLCRATVDRYGRLRAFTFMRTALFDDGRMALAAQIREAVNAAQAPLRVSLGLLGGYGLDHLVEAGFAGGLDQDDVAGGEESAETANR
ncbi:hypothetical protein [Glycomyces tritici]|uniref:Uncharacterized protein n=1 Tax=Glycomyces tritici TaxID=2665176 RepID=A0ABT7YUK6_9ACTN|nr:hypothetical protein [Glycomyces tritici]MDN3241530.1 hypothetical protein [Glycomyces tritici]MDN3242317.1 hypothetical protein [Glycomyces tritici]